MKIYEDCECQSCGRIIRIVCIGHTCNGDTIKLCRDCILLALMAFEEVAT